MRIDPFILAELVTRAAVPTRIAPYVFKRWTQDGSDGPAFLKVTTTHRYTLADKHAHARAFLEEAGRRELEGSRAGKKSVSRKLGKLHRLGRS